MSGTRLPHGITIYPDREYVAAEVVELLGDALRSEVRELVLQVHKRLQEAARQNDHPHFCSGLHAALLIVRQRGLELGVPMPVEDDITTPIAGCGADLGSCSDDEPTSS